MGELTATILAAEKGGEKKDIFLIPNGTIFVILLIFLVVLGVIAKWVVPPVSKVLAEREPCWPRPLRTTARRRNRWRPPRSTTTRPWPARAQRPRPSATTLGPPVVRSSTRSGRRRAAKW